MAGEWFTGDDLREQAGAKQPAEQVKLDRVAAVARAMVRRLCGPVNPAETITEHVRGTHCINRPDVGRQCAGKRGLNVDLQIRQLKICVDCPSREGHPFRTVRYVRHHGADWKQSWACVSNRVLSAADLNQVAINRRASISGGIGQPKVSLELINIASRRIKH